MHLIVTIHGMWGVSGHMNSIVKSIKEKFGDRLLIHNSTANTFFNTYHGIDHCGKRLYTEIIEYIRLYNAANAPDSITTISFVGYSAGGLIARYCAGLLYSDHFFDTVTPAHFVTIATPHLGIRWTNRRVSGRLYNFFADRFVNLYAGRTGLQLSLTDASDTTSNVPLLLEMTLPGSVFFEAWKLFQCRYVYSNTSNDNIVPYCTASLSTHNKWRGVNMKGSRGDTSEESDVPCLKESIATTQSSGYRHLLECARVDDDITEIVITKSHEYNIGDISYFMVLTILFLPFILIHAILLMIPLRIFSICQPSPSSSALPPRLHLPDTSFPRDECPWLILQHARTIPIHRVSVYIPGVHTHALIICRRTPNAGGMEVIRHLVDEVLVQQKSDGQNVTIVTE